MAKRFIDYLAGYLRERNDYAVETTKRVLALLEGSEQDFTRRIRNLAMGMEKSQRIEFYNDSADEQMLLASALQFARRSMFIAAYAQFEDSLKWICRHAQKLELSTVSERERGFYIGPAKNYLSNIVVDGESFNDAAFGEAWREIDGGWRCVRNTLVHDNGIVETGKGVIVPTEGSFSSQTDDEFTDAADAEKIRAFIADRAAITLKFGELYFDEDVVEPFLGVAQLALDAILEELIRLAPPSPPSTIRDR